MNHNQASLYTEMCIPAPMHTRTHVCTHDQLMCEVCCYRQQKKKEKDAHTHTHTLIF